MKSLIDSVETIRSKFKHLISIKSLPAANKSIPVYGLIGVENIADAKNLILSTSRKDGFSIDIHQLNILAKMLLVPHLFDPVKGESITFGTPDKRGSVSYSIIAKNGTQYNVHGVDVKAFIKEDEIVRQYRANDGTNIYVCMKGQKHTEVLFYRKGDTNGKKIVEDYVKKHYGHVMVKAKVK